MFLENEGSFVLTEIQLSSACQGSRLPASHLALLPLLSRFSDSGSLCPIMVSNELWTLDGRPVGEVRTREAKCDTPHSPQAVPLRARWPCHSPAEPREGECRGGPGWAALRRDVSTGLAGQGQPTSGSGMPGAGTHPQLIPSVPPLTCARTPCM